jgi:hypothetical protein
MGGLCLRGNFDDGTASQEACSIEFGHYFSMCRTREENHGEKLDGFGLSQDLLDTD